MVLKLYSSILVLLAYALSVRGIAIPADASSLAKRDDKFLKLDFVVKNESIATNGTHSKRYSEIPLNNTSTEYVLTLNFGTDLQPIDVVIDTGSSDLWVGSSALTPRGYDSSKSSDYKDLGYPFYINYYSGEASGEWGTDLVTIPNGPSLKNFQFAEVTQTAARIPAAGVLGVGYVGLEQTGSNPKYPNFPQALKNAGIINKNAYSLYLDEDGTTGSIIFGGYDTEKFSGGLASLPILASSNRLEVALDSVTISNGTEISINDTVVLDSGSSSSYLPNDVLADIASAAGLEFSEVLDLIYFNCSTPINGSIGFNFDGKRIEVPLSSTVRVFEDGYCILGFSGNYATGGSNTLGADFLQHAYVVYNLDDNVLDIAQAAYSSKSNIVPIS